MSVWVDVDVCGCVWMLICCPALWLGLLRCVCWGFVFLFCGILRDEGAGILLYIHVHFLCLFCFGGVGTSLPHSVYSSTV